MQNLPAQPSLLDCIRVTRNRPLSSMIAAFTPESCDKLTQMARSALQYVFATLLALLSTQAVVPSVRVAATVEIACRFEAEQQIGLEARCIRVDAPGPQSPLTYGSRTRPEPDAAVLFQRPPPLACLFS